MTAADPIVSIIIPAYNMGDFLDEAIASVVDGTFASFEILVVDDGSTDNTAAIMAPYIDPQHERYDARISYHRKENGGKATAVNHGLQLAKGAYITFLDADDQLTPESLTARLEHLEKNSTSQPDLIIGGFEVFNRQGTLGTRVEPADADPNHLQRQILMGYKTPFHMNSCLFARSLVDRVGDFDTRLIRCQDIDYSIRSLQANPTIRIVPAIVYRYRKHRASIKNRLRFRYKTALHRPRVVWKNVKGLSKWLIVPYGFSMDLAKMAFELAGNYTK